MVDTKKPPYFDDFDEKKHYHRVLFRPGRPVQARELNTIQSQLQKQIERVGSHLFENGSQILPGTEDSVVYRNNVGFVKVLVDVNTPTDEIISKWVGKTIASTSTPAGIVAKILGVKSRDSLNEVRFFVDYLQADTETGGGDNQAFVPGQTISITDALGDGTITYDLTVSSVGKISLVTIPESVYYYNGDFILVDAQSLFLEPLSPTSESDWNNLPTTKVGLSIARSVITFQEDETLNDNATYTDNYGAPGADRLHIAANLVQVPVSDQGTENFIPLIILKSGAVQFRVRRTEYAVIEDTFARRTYDESGDYTVRSFALDVKPFLSTNSNSGVHIIDEFAFGTAAQAEAACEELFGIRASHLILVSDDARLAGKYLPGANREQFFKLADSKLTLQINPGKAYVRGYEIEKIAPSYVDIDKARATRFAKNQTVNTNLGVYVFVSGVLGVPDLASFENVEIHATKHVAASASGRTSPGAKLGTAQVLGIEYFSGTQGDPDAVYKLYLFNIKADQGKDLTKMASVYTARTTGTDAKFSANIELQYYPLTGSVTVTTPATGSTTTVTGAGTLFASTEALSVGDYIRLNREQEVQVSAVDSNTAISIKVPSVGFTTDITSVSVEIGQASFFGLNTEQSLLFSLPNNYVATIRGATSDKQINTSDIPTSYSVKKTFQESSNASGNLHVSLLGAYEQFPSTFAPSDYIVINTATGEWVDITSANTEVRLRELIISGVDASSSYRVIATIERQPGIAAKEKTKIAWRGSFEGGLYAGRGRVVSAANASGLSTVSLEKVDILKVTRIVMSPNFTDEPSSAEDLTGTGCIDITSRYLLDDGQRDYYYGVGSVYLKPGAAAPTGRVAVEFDYFEHVGSGDYFSVDSYIYEGEGSNITYTEIPTYKHTSGRIYQLRDVLDFRPALNSSGELDSSTMVCSRIDLAYHFYLNRSDNLYLDRLGTFRIATGVPDLNPITPAVPADGMSIYHLDLVAYTGTIEECFTTKIDNRRFTMRDIGRIEQRVSNLEYYTILSLLEKEAKELEIKDANGMDRFKNGFIVDNFTSHLIGAVGTPEHKCSVDTTEGELRPSIVQKGVDLVERASLTTEQARDQYRAANKYTKTGKLFTLPILEHVPFVTQPLCSQVENVNPYAKFTYKGRLTLEPAVDSWRDTKTLPKVTVVDDTAYKAAQAGVRPGEVIWGEWELNWTKSKEGKPKKSYRRYYGDKEPDKNHNHPWPIIHEWKTETITTTRSKLTRQGVVRDVVDRGYKTESLGSRVVSTVAADFIRPRLVYIEGHGFMPNARLYAFFDDAAVSARCVQLHSQTLSGKVNFTHVWDNLDKYVARNSDWGKRIFFEDIKDVSNLTPRQKQDFKLLFNYASTALPTGMTHTVGDGIAGDITFGQGLVADQYGSIGILLSIPRGRFKTGDRQFKLTTDQYNTSGVVPRSQASATYIATGWIDNVQETELAIRQFEVTQRNVSGVKYEKEQSKDTIIVIDTEDPIAESFVVNEKGGCFITAVDVFFRTKDPTVPIKLQIRPLSNDGYPTDNLMPFGEVLKPASDVVTNDVNITFSTITIRGDGDTPGYTTGPWTGASKVFNDAKIPITTNSPISYSTDPHLMMIPTRFYFNAPIYLQEKGRYAIVLISDSTNYEAWVAQYGPVAQPMGGVPVYGTVGDSTNLIIGTNKPIDGDKFIDGVFFRSSNGVTWNADQLVDLKFALHKAKFDISSVGTLDYVNEPLTPVLLEANPIETFIGSKYVRVHHTNHGMPAHSIHGGPVRVKFNGVVGGNGVEAGENTGLNHPDGFALVPGRVELDSYVIELDGEATATGFVGGEEVYATECVSFDTLFVNAGSLEFPETTVEWKASTTNGSNVSYVSTDDEDQAPFKVSDFDTFAVNQSYDFETTKVITSAINENNFQSDPQGPSLVTSNGVGDKKALKIRALLKSSNQNLSPVIDADRISVIAVQNRLNNPKPVADADLVKGLDYIQHLPSEYSAEDSTVLISATPAIQSVAGLVTFSNADTVANKGRITITINPSSDSATVVARKKAAAEHLSKLDVGKLVTIAGTTGSLNNCQNALVLSVEYTPTELQLCTVQLNTKFNGSGGAEAANFTLIQKENYIDEVAPEGGSAAYKYATIRLTLARPSTALRINFDAYRHESCEIKVYYKIIRTDDNTPYEDLLWIEAPFNIMRGGELVNVTPEPNNSPLDMTEYTSTINNLPPFTGVAVKIVGLGGNSAFPPKVANFKAIALDE